MTARFLLVLLVAACVSCDKTPPPPAAKKPEPPKAEYKEPMSTSFASEVTKEEYPHAATTPEGKIKIRFDFANVGTTEYIFTQTSVTGSSTGENGMNSMEAALIITSKGGGVADVTIKDINVKGAQAQTEPIYLMNMKDDGTGDWDRAQGALIKMLFPIPQEELALGESADVPLIMPFNAGSSVFPCRGKSTVTLTRFADIGGRTCAQLDVIIDVTELEVPVEMKDKLSCSMTGVSRFYYDIEKKVFVYGTVANLLKVKVAIGDAESQSISNDNLLRIRLK